MTLVELGQVAGLRLTAHRSAQIGFMLLWIGFSLVALALLNQALIPAILGGLAAALAHFASELWHQLGHAWAARRVGYPMIGVRYWWVLGASIYPKDEPPLPGSVHIRRALGGPLFSILMGVALLIAAAALATPQPAGPWYVLLFAGLDNLLVFGLGAFLPLGFTDGSTILRWWGK